MDDQLTKNTPPGPNGGGTQPQPARDPQPQPQPQPQQPQQQQSQQQPNFSQHQSQQPNLSQMSQPQQSQSSPGSDRFIEDRMSRMNSPLTPPAMPPMQGRPFDQPPFVPFSRKSKLIAGLLAFFIPGTGHLYLGLMQRGLTLMALLILDICTIVYFSTGNDVVIPLVTLFGLMIPIIYFYNIFDALQCTEKVNARNMYLMHGNIPESHAGQWFDEPKPFKKNNFGILLIAGGLIFLFFSTKPQWLSEMFDMMGTYIGAIVLIAAGIFLFLRENKK